MQHTPRLTRSRRNSFLAGIVCVFCVLALGVAGYVYMTRTVSVHRQTLGHGVDVSGGKVPARVKATPLTANLPITHAEAAGEAVSLTPSGPLPAPVTLRFKLNKPYSPDEPVFVASREKSGQWEYQTPKVSQDGQYAEITTNHFSDWVTFRLPSWLSKESFKNLGEKITGIDFDPVAPPKCDEEAAVRKDNFTIDSTAADTINWCAGMQGSKKILKVVNRRSYPLQLDFSGMAIDEDALNRQYASLSKLLRIKSNGYVLMPGSEVQFDLTAIKRGQMGKLTTMYGKGAPEALSIELLLNEIGLASSLAGKKIDIYTAAAIIDKIASSDDCAEQIYDISVTGIALECGFKEAFEKELGLSGTIYSVTRSVFGMGHNVVQQFIGSVDNLRGKDKYEVWVKNGEVTVSASSSSSANEADYYRQYSPRCPSGGSPTVTVDSFKTDPHLYYGTFYSLRLMMSGKITNPTSAPIRVKDIGFYLPDKDRTFPPNFSLSTDWMDLTNNSAVVPAHGSIDYTAKTSNGWDTANKPFPTSIAATLHYPFSEIGPTSTSWVFENVDYTCQPDYRP